MAESQPSRFFFVTPLADDFAPAFITTENDLLAAFERFKESGRDFSLPYAVFRLSEVVARVSPHFNRATRKVEPRLEEWPRRWWKGR